MGDTLADKFYDVKWRYSTRAPKKTHCTYPWLPLGHNYGYRMRRDLLHPNRKHYQFYCMCKWRTTTWWSSKARALKMADTNHYAKLKDQGRLL